ncbi:MAG: glucose-1-phosphate adenylyltransferase [Elusimicrobiales bacterium]|nr:glucose-1-phosphate adenylyltransferase [Elusimicrobiales bacterium]
MKVMGVIMAGGKGERLYPLTKERSKPAVPFGGKYRIIDFVLSNFINSGIFSTYVLVQYMSQSLIEYLHSTWNLGGMTREHFITVVPPQMRLGEMWYRGTADSVKQNLNLISDYKPDLVAIFGADHIYRMDIKQMIDAHLASKADVTVAALRVPLKEGSRFGTMVINNDNVITAFEEKPKNPKPMPNDPNSVLASMGNYIFNYETLVKVLHGGNENGALDFGKNILPNILKQYKVCAYNFSDQKLPGAKDYEEQNYWRDVGTIKAFWQTHMDLLGAKPKLDLNNKLWPIQNSRHNSAPSKIIESNLQDCMISDGCSITQSSLKRCILGNDVIIHEHCQLEDCIIMDACEIKAGTRMKKVIMDRFNTIAAKSVIGYNAEEDAQHYYIDPDGIIVMPRGISKWQ